MHGFLTTVAKTNHSNNIHLYKNHYKKNLIELACLVRIERICIHFVLDEYEPHASSITYICYIFCASSGALSNTYNPYNSNPTSLCAICSNHKTCPRNVSERYYGYQGAYRCLTEGAGDVAFVSHLTVFDFTGKDNDFNPGKDFKLLCPDGTRAGKVTTRSLVYTVEPLHNGHPGAELSGHCREVSIRVKCIWIDARLGRKILAVAERWPL